MNPTTPSLPLTRRHFVVNTALAASAATLGLRAAPADAAQSEPRFSYIGFSKPFLKLSAAETADLVAEVGWDGIECPVRARGQIEPARVTDDLPAFVETLRKRKLDVQVVTTDILSMEQPHAENVLRTMAKLGLKRLRLGSFRYDKRRPPVEQLNEVRPKLQGIAAACRQYGLQAGFQNHSGADHMGAPIWDVYSVIRDMDPRHIGFCFDIGHATVEGGLSWPVEARLAEPFFTAVFVKDFLWTKGPKGWDAAWCNLGEGMVNPTFFDWLKQTSYRGPISQHHEYKLGDRKQMIAHMQRDLKTLKSWLA